MIQQRTNWLKIAILWTAGIAAAMQFAKFSVAFDALTMFYGADPALVGLALSIVGMIGLVFGVSAGVLSGHIGYARVLVAGLIIGAVSSAIQALLPPLPIMIASRIIEGMSHLGIVVTAPTMMASFSSEGHRSIIMGLWGTFFGVAFALMASLGVPIIAQHGAGGLFLAHGLLMAGLAACAMVVFKRPDISNAVEPATLLKPQLTRFIRENLKVYSNARTAMPGLIFFFHTSMFIALLTFLPRLTSDPSVTAFLLVVLPLLGITGAFCAGVMAQYLLSPVSLAIIAYGAVGAVVVVVHWTIITGADFVSASMVLVFVAGIVPGAVFAMIPFLSRHPSEQALANGAVVQMGNIGSTIGPPVFAAIISASGSFGLMLAVITLCICGIGVALFAAAYTKSAAHRYS
jgi:MFS transporter, AAHS family, 3-hydroxyphenylpropionic acid transporter